MINTDRRTHGGQMACVGRGLERSPTRSDTKQDYKRKRNETTDKSNLFVPHSYQPSPFPFIHKSQWTETTDVRPDNCSNRNSK